MTQAFNQMKENVRDYIRALHDKSEAESQLHEQQVTNLRMQSLLDTSACRPSRPKSIRISCSTPSMPASSFP
jgi:hypothetical protein